MSGFVGLSGEFKFFKSDFSNRRRKKIEEPLLKKEIDQKNSIYLNPKKEFINLSGTAAMSLGAFGVAFPSLLPFALLGLGCIAVGFVAYNWDSIVGLGIDLANYIAYQGNNIMDIIDVDNYSVNMTSVIRKIYVESYAEDGLAGDWTGWLLHQHDVAEQYGLKASDIFTNYEIACGFPRINLNYVNDSKVEQKVAYDPDFEGNVVDNSVSPPLETHYTKEIIVDLWTTTHDLPVGLSSLTAGLTDEHERIISEEYYDVEAHIEKRNARIKLTLKGMGPKIFLYLFFELDDLFDLFDVNVRVRAGNYDRTKMGDIPANVNPYADYQTSKILVPTITLDDPINWWVYDVANIKFNPDFVLKEGASAINLPNISDVPAYNEVQKDMASGMSEGVTEESGASVGEGTGESEEEGQENPSTILDYLKAIWNFLIVHVSPGMSQVTQILELLTTVYSFLGEKFQSLDNSISQGIGSITSRLSLIANDILLIPQRTLDLVGQFDSKVILNAVAAIPNRVSDTMSGLFEDAGVVWSGIKESLGELSTDFGNGLVEVKEGIEAGIKDFSGKLSAVKDSISEKISSMSDSLVLSIEGVQTKVESGINSISQVGAGVLTWLKNFFVPDFSGIKDSWVSLLDKLKGKFKPILDLTSSFSNVFSSRKSIYDIEITIFKQKIRPVPITLKPAIDVFRAFANALCILLTLWRTYKRFVGEGDVIAT